MKPIKPLHALFAELDDKKECDLREVLWHLVGNLELQGERQEETPTLTARWCDIEADIEKLASDVQHVRQALPTQDRKIDGALLDVEVGLAQLSKRLWYKLNAEGIATSRGVQDTTWTSYADRQKLIHDQQQPKQDSTCR